MFCCLWASASFAAGRGVAVREAVVRSAPFEVAPEIARVHAGETLSSDDQPKGAWLRVRIPDGRYGFIHAADTEEATAAPPPPAEAAAPPAPDAPPPDAPAPDVSALPSAVAQTAAAAQPPETEPSKLGVMFSLLPTGTLSTSNVSADSAFAMAVAPFFDAPLSPNLALGLSPQVIFRVKGDGSAGEPAKEFDLRARLTARAPVSPTVAAFARVSPGYSIVALPSSPAGSASVPNPAGLMLDLSVGTEVALLPRLFLTVDLGYQFGFQSSSDGELHTRYLHLGAGLAIGL